MSVDDVIADVRDKMRGRTYFEGSPRHPDEMLVAEIDRLRAECAEAAYEIKLLRMERKSWQAAYEAACRLNEQNADNEEE